MTLDNRFSDPSFRYGTLANMAVQAALYKNSNLYSTFTDFDTAFKNGDYVLLGKTFQTFLSKLTNYASPNVIVSPKLF